MSDHKLEKDMMVLINEGDSVMLRLLKFFTAPMIRKIFKDLEKDPEFVAHLDGMQYYNKKVSDFLKTHQFNDPKLQKILDKHKKRL